MIKEMYIAFLFSLIAIQGASDNHGISPDVVSVIERILSAQPQNRPQKLYEPVTPQSTGIFSAGFQLACGLDLVELSPSGRYLILSADNWRQTTSARSSRRIAIFDLECTPRDQEENCGVLLEALDGLRLVSWNEDESRVFAVEGDRNLIEVEVDFQAGVPARTAGRLPLPPPLAISIASTDRTPSSTLGAEGDRFAAAFLQASVSARQGQSIMGLYLNGRHRLALFEEHESLNIEAILNGRMIDTGLPGPLVRHAQVSNIDESAAMISDRGLRKRLGDRVVGIAAESYELPIISPNSGRAVGYYTPTRLRVEGDHPNLRRRVSVVNRRLSRGEGELLSAAVSSAQDLATVTLDRDGSTSLDVSWRGRRFGAHCPDQRGYAIASTRRLNLGTTLRKLDALYVTPPGQSRGLVVYFSGGPGEGILSAHDNYIVRRYLELRYSVAAVNYSGTKYSGQAVFDRIRDDGVASLREDARVVASYLSSLGVQQQLIVSGASLGALPALALDAELGTTPHRTILLTPFLRHRDPASWVTIQERIPYQRAYEARLLGLADDVSKRQFQSDIEALQVQRSSAPLFAAFGSLDNVSLPADLLTAIGEQDQVITVPGTHELATTSSELWGAIASWLDASESTER